MQLQSFEAVYMNWDFLLDYLLFIYILFIPSSLTITQGLLPQLYSLLGTQFKLHVILRISLYKKWIIDMLTLKEPGFLDPSHGRGADSAPPRSWKPIDETSSVWY